MKSPFNPLTVECVRTLEKFLPLLAKLDDFSFKARCGNSVTIGKRVWLTLNALENLLTGVETGTLKYSRRIADKLIATDRSFALMEIYRVISALEDLSLRNRLYPLRAQKTLRVKTLAAPAALTNFGNEILRLQQRINSDYQKIARASGLIEKVAAPLTTEATIKQNLSPSTALRYMTARL